MTETTFKYNDNPAALGIDISPDAQFKWCLNRAAKRAARQSQRDFAASLLAQWGKWSDKQRKWAMVFYRDNITHYGYCLSEECRNRSVRKFIAEVGTSAALAHAFRLREQAAKILGDVSGGKEYADTHDRYSARYWSACEDNAARKVEMAERIRRIVEGGAA